MIDPTSLTHTVAPALRLGEDFDTFHYSVTSNDIERFVTGSGDNGQPWQSPADYISGLLPAGTPAPPAYFIALDPYERGDLRVDDQLDAMPVRWTGGGNAWNQVEYTRPFRVGDEVAVTVRFTVVHEKEGSAGRLLFRERTTRYVDAGGNPIAESASAHIRAYDPASVPWDDHA
jgi:hypothetical protein